MKSFPSQISTFVSSEPNKRLFLLLTVLAGIIILYPHLNFQPRLAPGDHGRDLYTYKVVHNGGVPLKDFSTKHGPLMPYYYSLFYHMFNVSLESTLLGYNLCILLAGVLIYLICSSYLDPLVSFCAALWYWAFRGGEFFYTYNHIGGIVMMLAVVYFFVRFVKFSDIRNVYSGFLCSTLLLFIRPTIGLSALVTFTGFLLIHNLTNRNTENRNRILIYFLLSSCAALITLCIYWLLTKDIPRYISAGDTAFWQRINLKRIAHSLSVFHSLLKTYFFPNTTVTIFSLTFLASLLRTFMKIVSQSSDKETKKQLLTILGFLLVLITFNFFEVLIAGVWFYAMWNLNLIVVVILFAFTIGFAHLKYPVRVLVFLMLIALPLLTVFRTNNFLTAVKQPENVFRIGPNRAYLLPSERSLTYTLQRVTSFLEDHLERGETFLAIPYDPIYYYLSTHDSATTQLDILNMSESKEEYLLSEIKGENVRFIVVSNRAYWDSDKRFGVIGKDYGKKLQQYMDGYFEEAATFGAWGQYAGWTIPYGVRILRRK